MFPGMPGGFPVALALLFVASLGLWAFIWLVVLVREAVLAVRERRRFRWLSPMGPDRRLNAGPYAVVCAVGMVLASLMVSSESWFEFAAYLVAGVGLGAVYDRVQKRWPAWRTWREADTGPS